MEFTEDLRTFATFYVHFLEMDKEKKDKFYSFIREANEDQLTYLVDFRKMKSVLTEQDFLLLQEQSMATKAGRWLKDVTVGRTPTEKAKDFASDVGGKAGEVAGKAYGKAGEIAGKISGGYSALVQKAIDYGKTHGVQIPPAYLHGVAAATAAAILATVAYKIYKRFFSAAAKACAKAPDKSACMKKFKMQALSKQAAALQAGMAGCSHSKNPAQCKSKLQARLAKVRKQVQAARA